MGGFAKAANRGRQPASKFEADSAHQRNLIEGLVETEHLGLSDKPATVHPDVKVIENVIVEPEENLTRYIGRCVIFVRREFDRGDPEADTPANIRVHYAVVHAPSRVQHASMNPGMLVVEVTEAQRVGQVQILHSHREVVSPKLVDPNSGVRRGTAT